MLVIFYDRRNRREVRSDQLMSIGLYEHILVGDPSESKATGRRIDPSTGQALTAEQHLDLNDGRCFWDWDPEMAPGPAILRERLLANIGYKSATCPSYQNWDLYCQEQDLVFVRLHEPEVG